MATSSENISNQQQLGQLLRNHRISQEWSLEDVSSQMRLDVLVLRHLEEGNLEAPPGRVFMRGFLRTYIQFLQIPPSELELFKEFVEQNIAPEEKITPVHLDSLESKTKGINLRKWISGLGLCAALFLIWQMNSWDSVENIEISTGTNVSEKENSISRDQNEQNDASQTGALLGATSEDITESKIDENFSDQERQSGSETSQNEMTEPTMEQDVETEERKPTILVESLEDDQTITDNLSIFPVLELRAEESVWIAVQSDNEQPSLHYLKAGEFLSWETAKEFYTLSIGNTEVVQVRLDEKQYSLPGNQGLLMDWKIKLDKMD
ncbi:MAG: RodZ domain-containing protein [SAR324 cluster bacterium]|nr:RodZ domain-containing protein [SAR324 cluster bacterium]